MNQTTSNHGCVAAFVAAAVACGCLLSDSVQSAEVPTSEVLERASQIVRFGGAPGGVCVVVGSGDAELAIALAKQGSFVVHCLATQPERRDEMRRAIRSCGMYGTVSAGVLKRKAVPGARYVTAPRDIDHPYQTRFFSFSVIPAQGLHLRRQVHRIQF